MKRAALRRALALLLAFGLSIAAASLPAHAGPSSPTLRGKVFDVDGATPREGVVVALVDDSSERIYRATPTGPDGTFLVDSAPAGRYRVVAETESGAYLAGQPVDLAQEANRPVALTLGASPNFQQTGTASGGSGTGLRPWAKWVIVGAIGIAALVVIDEVTTDEEESASPF